MMKLQGQMKFKIPDLKIILLVFALICFGSPKNSDAQTWVTTKFWDPYYGVYSNRDSTGVGPFAMCKTPNGNIYMLVQESIDEQENLLLLNSTGGLGTVAATSHSGGIFSEHTNFLHPCQDNGVVYNVTHQNLPYGFTKTVKTGPHSWTKTNYFPLLVRDVVPTFYNTVLLAYYDLYTNTDSLVEVDSMGNFIRSKYFSYNHLNSVQDSDLIIYDIDKLTKQDWNGNIKWTINDSNLVPISADTSNIFCCRGDTVFKIRAKDGSIVWNKIIPYTNPYISYHGNRSISITRDSGLVSTNGYDISRYDSSGNLMWTKTDSFPSFGYGAIVEDASGYLITGGAYLCVNAGYIIMQRGFGYFITRLDSNGNGTLDSTDHYFTGNANDNNNFSFADDAAFIGAASGSSGQPLPSVIQPFCNNSVTAFGPDWTGRFASGINHKFSDADGNGIIDTNDIHTVAYTNTINNNSSWSHWRKASTSSVAPNLYVSIAEDTLMPGDSATIYVYTDAAAIVDSIYSISMELSIYPLFDQTSGVVIGQQNNFGTLGINSFSYYKMNQQMPFGVKYLLCKSDHLNSTLQGDTLVKFRMATAPVASHIQNMYFSFHAITEGGYDVLFNPILDSVYFFNPTASTKELNDAQFSLFPNPTSGSINLSGLIQMDRISLFDSEGRKVLDKIHPPKEIDLSDLPDGIYFVQVFSGENTFRRKLALIH